MTPMAKQSLPLSEVYRLIEPGPVVLVSTMSGKKMNIMTMSWHMMVDFAHIKLMAGDVNKAQPQNGPMMMAGSGGGIGSGMASPQATEKTFEDYHLYALPQATTIHDRETKQVEFLHASGIQSKRQYVYDGARFDRNFNVYQDVRQIQQYGTQSNPHVWVLREFANSDANHLGVPLPKGRVRFYRRDQDGQVEFTGENEIDHTPKDETVRVYTGNA